MKRVLAVASILVLSGCVNDASLVNAPLPGCDENDATGSPASVFAEPGVRMPRRGEPNTAVAEPVMFAEPATGADLVRAMGREPDGEMTPTLMGSPLASAIFSGLGELDPTEGGSFVWLST